MLAAIQKCMLAGITGGTFLWAAGDTIINGWDLFKYESDDFINKLAS